MLCVFYLLQVFYKKKGAYMDFLGIFVDGNMLETFCNMFRVRVRPVAAGALYVFSLAVSLL